MKALTVRQPWASAIFDLGKTIENRSRSTKHRGPLAIHAGLAWDRNGDRSIQAMHLRVPSGPQGAIIGLVDVIGCHSFSHEYYGIGGHPDHIDDCAIWGMDTDYHWVLANARPIEPIPCRGALGLWTVPDDIAEQIEVTP